MPTRKSPVTPETAFGQVLQDLRKGREISQEELGFESGFHRTYISQIERGLKSPSLATVFRLASALRVAPSELVGRTEALCFRPPGSGSFTLYDEPGKARGKGSGVKPIKDACMLHLRSMGWNLETPIDVATLKRPGPIDATHEVGTRLFCLEWETGNISSSHRAMNKLALGILKKLLIGGVLVLPTRKMYWYLTDRVGNYPELEPYFPLWRAVQTDEGLLAVIAVEHDAVSRDVPRISKGTDGRALA